MAQRDQIPRSFGRLNRGDPSYPEDVAFLGPSREDKLQGRGRHADRATGAREATRFGLVSDVHHMGLPGPVEMAQFS
jgi:hypothetical protein